MSRVFFLLLMIIGCSKPVTYTKEKMLSMAWKTDPTVSVILPKSMKDGVTCEEYGEGCLGVHIVGVQGLEMLAVEYMSEAQALAGAKKFRGYYSKNWLFDDVTGEPALEKFVVQGLEAKKP